MQEAAFGMIASTAASVVGMSLPCRINRCLPRASTRFRGHQVLVGAVTVLMLVVGCDRGQGSSPPDGSEGLVGPSSPAVVEQGGHARHEDELGARDAAGGGDRSATTTDASSEDGASAGEGASTVGEAPAEADGEPERLVPMGTTPTDALAILAEDGALPDEAQIEQCGFRKGGKTLGEVGRVDIIECVYADTMAYVSAAWIVIRPSNLAYEMTIEELASVTEVPGETGTYSLGPLVMKNGTISVRVKEKWTTYGNTGDPDAPADKSVERVQKDFVCFVVDGVWECNRTVAP